VKYLYVSVQVKSILVHVMMVFKPFEEDHEPVILFFLSFTVHLDIITSLFIKLNAQLDYSRNVKTHIEMYIKMFLHVSV